MDLVGDPQNASFGAKISHSAEVLIGGHVDAALSLNRLQKKGRYILCEGRVEGFQIAEGNGLKRLD